MSPRRDGHVLRTTHDAKRWNWYNLADNHS